MIDGLAGYNLTLQGDTAVRHLHRLCRHLILVAVILLLTSLCYLRIQTRSAWILNSIFSRTYSHQYQERGRDGDPRRRDGKRHGRVPCHRRPGHYIADNIVFLRHLELQGELRKAIGVLKKRTSDYERTLRQFRITSHGITVGDPLTRLRGVLSGTPELASPDDRGERAD